ncbi:unnamed protein product, partial [Closterium sp. Naga37s-1]
GDLGSRLHAICAAFAVTHLTDVTTIAVWPNDEHMPHIRFADLFAVAKNSTGRSSTRRRREHEDSLWVRSVSWPIDHWRDHLEPTRETVSVPACSHGGAAGGIHSHAADSFELFFSPETNTWLKSDAMEACEYEQAVQACLASLHPSPAVAVTVERENLSRIRASHAVLPENGLDYSPSGCVQQPGAAAGTCGMSQPSSPYLITPSRPYLDHEGREGENEGTETAEAAEGESGYDAPFPLRATEARASRCRGNTRGGGGGRAGNGSLAGGRVGAMGGEDEHGGAEVDGAVLGSVDGDAREGSGGATVDERLECTRLEVRVGGKEGFKAVLGRPPPTRVFRLLFILSFPSPPNWQLFALIPISLSSSLPGSMIANGVLCTAALPLPPFVFPRSSPDSTQQAELFASSFAHGLLAPPPALPLYCLLAELFALSFAHGLRAPSPASPLARFVAAQGMQRTRAFLLLPPPPQALPSSAQTHPGSRRRDDGVIDGQGMIASEAGAHGDSRRQLQDSWSSSPDSSSTTDWSSPTPDSTSSSDWSSSPDTSSQWTAPADTSSDWTAPSDSSSSDYSSPSPDWSTTTTPSPPPPSDWSTDAGASNSDWVSNNDWQAPSSPSPPPSDWSAPSPPPPSDSTGDSSSSGSWWPWGGSGESSGETTSSGDQTASPPPPSPPPPSPPPPADTYTDPSTPPADPASTDAPAADTYTDPGSTPADPASTNAPAADTNSYSDSGAADANSYSDSGAAVDPAWGAGTDPNAATADNTADIAAATDAAASSGAADASGTSTGAADASGASSGAADSSGASSGATDASGASSGIDGSVSFVSDGGGDPSSSDSSGGDSSGGDSSNEDGPLTSNPSYGATMGGDEAMDSTTCNIYEGEWVWDEANRPAYNMESCPFINSVSPTTNCLRQKYGRQDQSWMHYSWKPKQCGGDILRFQAANFAQKMQNKVIALVGDSLITDGFMPSLLCQLAQVGTVSRVEGSALGSFVWRLDSHNLTVANYCSPFLMWTSANPVVIRKLRVQDPGLGDTAVNLGAFDPQWFDQVQTMDLIVFQSATHWPHAERWLRRFFVDRKWHRLDPEPDTMTAYKQALNKLGKSFNAGNSKRWDLPVPYFLSAPPRLVNCQGSYAPANRSTYEHMVRGNPQSRKWFPAQRDVLSPSKNIRFVDITHPSLYRGDAMLASQSPDSRDCLHPCLPGLPDIWVDLFYEVWKADPEFNS